MNDFKAELLAYPLSGIPASYWQLFLKIFADGVVAGDVERGLASLRARADLEGLSADKKEAVEKFLESIRGLYGL
jgi:hypothetical protein